MLSSNKQISVLKAAHFSGKTSYNVLFIVSIDYIWTVEGNLTMKRLHTLIILTLTCLSAVAGQIKCANIHIDVLILFTEQQKTSSVSLL